MNKIRTRFAPSPTGYLHVGGLRTALYAYLFAKKNDGDFLLKIEDTDRKRFVEGAVEKLIKSLDFLGLERNEGVVLSKVLSNNTKSEESKNYPGVFEVGEHGPYIQSEKLEIYNLSLTIFLSRLMICLYSILFLSKNSFLTKNPL